MNPWTWAVANNEFTAACVLCLAALVILAWRYVPEWNARAEERRRVRDLASFHAQLAAMTDAEVETWRAWADREADSEWDAILAAVGLTNEDVRRSFETTPIFEKLAAERLRADLDAWGRGGAA